MVLYTYTSLIFLTITFKNICLRYALEVLLGKGNKLSSLEGNMWNRGLVVKAYNKGNRGRMG